jgi:hypothetical protein
VNARSQYQGDLGYSSPFEYVRAAEYALTAKDALDSPEDHVNGIADAVDPYDDTPDPKTWREDGSPTWQFNPDDEPDPAEARQFPRCVVAHGLQERGVAVRSKYHDGPELEDFPRVGVLSPWGQIDFVEHLTEGVVLVTTPSHGGIWLSEQMQGRLPAPARIADRWYEEDLEAWIPLYCFSDELGDFEAPANIESMYEHALASLKE